MNKSELIDAIATESGLTKTDAGKALDAFTEVVKNTLKTGDSITLVGFGTFKVADRAERQGLNPKTKEAITIPAARVPKFTPGKALKDVLVAEQPAAKKKK
ncbi:HU family DNA-binding protein [Kingella kingae]|uniref:HU family DNA-binding protein n=2 Tax=Kingella kingae TaxID=504 RepID=UPI0002584B41|nr:HU family DNA-binding protein [Kingella kingae]EIC13668.1 HupB1 [Kingella kingae PYKK081]MBD3614039.1 HU family DNA-binding protein [Kingella kingae]MBD3632380.1 HU family DNA-binding protein [Kingella kingae]MBD3659773.1 HU family DNA-binding protein [Kingella kingae]MDK4537240.1 HU family DNA-binding protein [Kingella kingae]